MSNTEVYRFGMEQVLETFPGLQAAQTAMHQQMVQMAAHHQTEIDKINGRLTRAAGKVSMPET